jgi:predicted permease
MPAEPMWRRYLRFFGPDARADIRDEIRFHLETRIRELNESGLPLESARIEAMRQFGDVAEIEEFCLQISREKQKQASWRERVKAWWSDLVLAARTLWRSRWFSATVIVTLAVGMSGGSGVFSVIDGWIIRGVRFPEPQELVAIHGTETRTGRELSVSLADYEDMAATSHLAAKIAAWTPDSFALSLERDPERVRSTLVSSNFFDCLRVPALLGRTFSHSDGEPGKTHVAIASYGFWKDRLAGDAGVIGSALTLNGETYTLIGVLPERFQFTLGGISSLWVPLHADPDIQAHRGFRYLQLLGRMKPGVTVNQLETELGSIAANLARAYPNSNADVGFRTISLRDEIGRHNGNDVILITFGITLLLLLIACSNVGALILIRAAGRKRHAAVQMAMGASRGRMFRQSALETLLLFAMAAVVGSGMGELFTRTLTSLIPVQNRAYLPDYGAASLNGFVVACAVGFMLIASLVFGTAPAWQASSVDVSNALKESGTAVSATRRLRRYRFALVVGQVILAMVLLSSTAVLITAFRSIWSRPKGFDPQDILTFRISLDERRYPDSVRRAAFFDDLEQGLSTPQGRPGIGWTIPFCQESYGTGFRLYGAQSAETPNEQHLPDATFNAVSTDYFRVLRAPLLAGRYFERRDIAASSPVAIVNDAFVRKFFHGRDPLGEPVSLTKTKNQKAVIVGVVRELEQDIEQQPGYPQIYVPLAQFPTSEALVMVRTLPGTDPLSALPEVRKQAGGIDRWQPVYDAQTLEDRLREGFAPFQIVSGMLAWFGVLAQVLAALGLYGAVSYSVSQRTQEIGIRAAIGAGRSTIVRLFMMQGAYVLVTGLVPGVVMSYSAAKLLQGMLPTVSGDVLWMLALTAATLGGILGGATVIPAMRAARLDPVRAIRGEN